MSRGNIDYDQIQDACRQGTGGKFLMANGTYTQGHTLVIDANGNAVDSGGTDFGSSTQAANQFFAGPTSGAAAAPTFRAIVPADLPALPESQITNLASDLATKAPLASPSFTGSPTAPTPAAGDNSTALATTAWVKSQGYGSSSASGTVTSVAMTVPPRQTVTGSPITGSGTLAITDNNQAANLVFAGPSSGSAAAPTFRSLAYTDLPARPTTIGYYLAGKPAAGATCYFDIPGNLTTFQIPANFGGASGKTGANPTASAVYTFYKSGSQIGTLTISTAGAYTWATTGGTAVSFTPGTDELSWTAPSSQDVNLSDVRFSIPVLVS